MGKQRAIQLNLNRTFKEKDFPSEVNKINAGKKDEVGFEPACVFSEEKTKLLWIIPRFWKIPRNLIFFVDGCKNAMKFKEGDDTMMPFWTKAEATEHIEKEIAKARVKESLISWGKAIIIIILLLIVIVIQFYSMSRTPF